MGESQSQIVDADEVAEPEGYDRHSLSYLQQTGRDRKNFFAALMDLVKTHSLGQIIHAYDSGGEYRRNI